MQEDILRLRREFEERIRQLEKRIADMDGIQASEARKLRYQLGVLGMKRAWQERGEDNVDASHPLQLDIFIPPDTKVIERAFLRLRLKRFRANSTFASETTVSGVTEEAVERPGTAFSTSVDGAHDHSGTVTADGSHDHLVPQHNHGFISDPHFHVIDHAIYEGELPQDVTVKINGTDRTAELGGPFNSDQTDIDITKYLSATGFNTVEFGSLRQGRVHATIFVELYLP